MKLFLLPPVSNGRFFYHRVIIIREATTGSKHYPKSGPVTPLGNVHLSHVYKRASMRFADNFSQSLKDVLAKMIATVA